MNSAEESKSLESKGLNINDDLVKNFGYSNLKSTFEGILCFIDNERVKSEVEHILNSINIIIANESLNDTLKRNKDDIFAILIKSDNTAQKISSDFIVDLQNYTNLLNENDKQDIFNDTINSLSNLKGLIDGSFEENIDIKENDLDSEEKITSAISSGDMLKYYFDSTKKKISQQAEANRDSFLGILIKKVIEEINKQCFLEGKTYIANLKIYIEKGGIKNKRASLNPFYDYANPIKSAEKMKRGEFKVIKELIFLHEEKKRKGLNLLSKNISERNKISYFLLATAVFTMLKNKHNHDDIIGLQEEKFYLLIDINDSIAKGDTDIEKALNIKKASIILRDLIDIIRYYISNFKKTKIEYVSKPRRTNLEKALEKKEAGAVKAMEYIDFFEASIEDLDVTKETVLNQFFNKSLLDITFSIFKQLGTVIKVDKFEDILNNEMLRNSIIFKDVLVLKLNNSTKNNKTKSITKVYHFLNKDGNQDDSLLESSKLYVDDLLAKLYESNKSNINAFEMKNIDILIERQQLKLNFYDLKDVYISYIGSGNFVILFKRTDSNNTDIIETGLKSLDTKAILDGISYFTNEFFINRGLIHL